MLICEMARYYRAQGMDLVDAIRVLYERYGYYKNGLISVSYPGADGAERMRGITAGLREEQPEEIAGLRVEGYVDYAGGVEMPIIAGRAAAARGEDDPAGAGTAAGTGRAAGAEATAGAGAAEEAGTGAVTGAGSSAGAMAGDAAGEEPQVLPGADVLEFQLEGGNKLMIRPSGTEPKIKAYLFAQGATEAEADEMLVKLDAAAKELLR